MAMVRNRAMIPVVMSIAIDTEVACADAATVSSRIPGVT